MEEWIAKYWLGAAFGAVTAIFAALYRRLSGRLKVQKNKNDAIEEGMRALLRDRLIERHEVYVERGYCTISTLDSIDLLYKAYQALGGNGTVPRLIEDLKKLPIRQLEKGY